MRLGRNKPLETVNNRRLLQRVVSQLAFLNGDIIIVTATEESIPPLAGSRLKTTYDTYPGVGPLAGIHAGLKASDTFYNVVVACDMPFLNRQLLRYMIEVSPGFDMVVPRIGEMTEPLHAIYSRNCVAPIETLIRQGTRNTYELFPFVTVRYMDAREIERFDPEHLSFFNINTETDLQKARELAERLDR